jgi:hypothetical protein
MELAIGSVDPKSDNQSRFVAALERLKLTIDRVDFRQAFVSMPPGRHPGDEGDRSIISVAPRMTYLAGLLARSPDAELIVVSHSFEIFGPLQDLARRTTKGLVGIAYFSSLIDFRYRATGIMDATRSRTGVQFYDLDEWLPELFGGTPISTADRQSGGEVFARIGL